MLSNHTYRDCVVHIITSKLLPANGSLSLVAQKSLEKVFDECIFFTEPNLLFQRWLSRGITIRCISSCPAGQVESNHSSFRFVGLLSYGPQTSSHSSSVQGLQDRTGMLPEAIQNTQSSRDAIPNSKHCLDRRESGPL